MYGFVFSKPLGSVVFWRYFFYVALVETLIVLGIYPIFGFTFYGEAMSFGIWLFNFVNVVFVLAALNLYAFKPRGIW